MKSKDILSLKMISGLLKHYEKVSKIAIFAKKDNVDKRIPDYRSVWTDNVPEKSKKLRNVLQSICLV